MIESYIIHLVIIIGIYIILTISLQLSVGFTGLFNIGHIAFFCIGAYATALLSLDNYSFLLCFLVSAVLSMISGFLLNFLIHKLKGDYFAIASLSFLLLIYSIALNWVSLTRGPLGLPGIPRPIIFGIDFSQNFNFLVLTISISLFSYLIIKKITSSPFGRVLEGIRDDELAMKVLGKDTFRVKSYVLATSAFFAGIAGSLYAYYINFIDPSSFGISQVIPILAIVIVGGLASLEGTVMSTIILILLIEPLRYLIFNPSIIGPVRQIIYALLAILILFYKPKGLYGRVEW
nr:branched-chain amino acid ABC transporter permease [Nanoarchaeum sp.]